MSKTIKDTQTHTTGTCNAEQYEQRKAERKAEAAAREAEYAEYRRELEKSICSRELLKKREEEASLPYLQNKQSELLDWLLENKPTHPEWDNKVSDFHAVEARIYAQTADRPNFRGVNEVSTVSMTV